MSDQDAFERILESLYDAMLDDTRFPAVSVLIDEACGLTGNSLLVGEGQKEDIRVFCIGTYRRGQSREDLDREYLDNYHPTDERVPRFRRLPDSCLVHIDDLYTAEELKDFAHLQRDAAPGRHAGQLERASRRSGRFPHRLEPERSCRLGWLGVFADRDDHGTAAPYPSVRPRPARAGPRRGAGHDRDRSARQLADRRRPTGPARADHGGQRPRPQHPAARRWVVGPGWGCCAPARPADRVRLERLVGDALPISGGVAVSGSMLLRRSAVLPPFVVHVKPVGVPQPDYGAQHVAGLVLIVEPGRQQRVDPGLVATTLGLTPAETQVAVWLAARQRVTSGRTGTRDCAGPRRQGHPCAAGCRSSRRRRPATCPRRRPARGW